MRLVRILSSVALAAAPLLAADHVRDLRLVGGLSASHYEADGNRVDVDDGRRFGLMGITSLGDLPLIGGPIVGAEVATTIADGDVEVDTRALTGHLGWAVHLPILFAIHAEGGVFGSVTQTHAEAGGADDDAFGWDWGLRAGAYWTLLGPFQVGVDLRWLASSRSELDLGAGERTLENDGLIAQLALGVRL